MRAVTGAKRSGLLDVIVRPKGWQVMTNLPLWSGLAPSPRSLRRAPQIAVSCVKAAKSTFPYYNHKKSVCKERALSANNSCNNSLKGIGIAVLGILNISLNDCLYRDIVILFTRGAVQDTFCTPSLQPNRPDLTIQTHRVLVERRVVA